jgi:hypothetical protein
MVGMGSIASAIGSLKTAADLAKGFLDLKEAAAVQGRVIELQGVILAAQSSALAAQSDQFALLEEIRSLKAKMADLEAWDTEKKRYERKNVGYGSFVYVLKPEERGTEPPHWACANCYEHGHIATVQLTFVPKRGQVWTCPSCKNTIDPGTHVISWPKD